MVASRDLVLISTSAIFTGKWGNLDHLMLWNIMGMVIHKRSWMSFISHVEIYEKWFHVQLSSFYSTAMAFNLFLKRKPTEKFSAYFHQRHFYRKWGYLDHLMLWNIMGMVIHKRSWMSFISHVEIYEKWFHVQLNTLHSTAMVFNF